MKLKISTAILKPVWKPTCTQDHKLEFKMYTGLDAYSPFLYNFIENDIVTLELVTEKSLSPWAVFVCVELNSYLTFF